MKQAVLFAGVVLLVGSLAVAQTSTGSSAGSSSASADKSASSTQTDNHQISNGPVAEVVSDANATIGWSVREPAGSMGIKYGTDREHLNQTADAVASSDGKNFHVRLQGLTAETRYYFQVTQKDQTVGGVGTFRTTATGAPPIKSKAIIPQ